MQLLQRLHRWMQEMQARRAVRIGASVLALAAVAAAAWPIFSVASSLDAQQSAILAALRESSAKKRDPAAMRLIERSSVQAGDREYGNPRLLPRPIELFDDEGEIPEATKRDLAWRFVAEQVPSWMPDLLVRSPTTTAAVAAGTLAALLAIVWLGMLVPALEWGAAFALLGAAFWALGWASAVQGLGAMALSLLLFGVLWWLVGALLASRRGPVAVARTSVLEGVRSWAAPAFAFPIALLIPMLALSRDPGQALYLAIPGFLDWGHTVIYTSAALLVVFFGCATTAFEMRDRQVWTVLTKPISRVGWLAGKWLGTLALAVALLAGGGIALATGAAFLGAQRPLDERDAREVRDTVLVGRMGWMPTYDRLAGEQLRDLVERAIESDAAIKADIATGTREAGQVRWSLAQQQIKQYEEEQRRIRIGDAKTFVFEGLRDPATRRLPMSLRYKFHGGADDVHERFPVVFEYQSGERKGQWEVREWIPTETYSLALSPDMVDEKGVLRLRIINVGFDESRKEFVPGGVPIYIDKDGIEVMATSQTFGENLLAGLLIDLVKVGFLAALAVVAGSVLSFPIAVLLSAGVFLMATLTPFLNVSLSEFRPDHQAGLISVAFHWIVRGIGLGIEGALHPFAERSPSDSLAQGRAITWWSVAESFALIGLVWTGAILLLGWLSIRRKEIAVYSGQG